MILTIIVNTVAAFSIGYLIGRFSVWLDKRAYRRGSRLNLPRTRTPVIHLEHYRRRSRP